MPELTTSRSKQSVVSMSQEVSYEVLKKALQRLDATMSTWQQNIFHMPKFVTDLEKLSFLADLDDIQIRRALAESKLERKWEARLSQPVLPPRVLEFESQSWAVSATDKYTSVNRGVRYTTSRAGQDVRAVLDGRVILATQLDLLGNTILIDHGLGVSTLYAHLEGFSVRAGANVVRDQLIGRTGASGLALSSQVYFEVRINGEQVNPLDWFDSEWYRQAVITRIFDAKRTLGKVSFISSSERK